MSGDLRDQMADAVRSTLARGLPPDELEAALVAATTTVAATAITATWLDTLASFLSSLPEQERKVLMFDMLMKAEEVRGDVGRRR